MPSQQIELLRSIRHINDSNNLSAMEEPTPRKPAFRLAENANYYQETLSGP